MCNLEENFSGRELGLTEEDSPSPFIRLQKKKRQDQLMHKVLEVKEEVRKLGGCWDMVVRVCGFLEGSSGQVTGSRCR